MKKVICKFCQKEFDNLNEFGKHALQKHNILAEKVYIDYVLSGVEPKCECGCGGTPKFKSFSKGFNKFILTHHNRVKGKNNFHKNPETHKKAIETQKKNWKEGKYKGWWENRNEETIRKIEGIKEKLRNDKERAKKISNSLKGIPKTDESKKKLSIIQKKRYQDNPHLREEASKRRVNWLKTKLSNEKSKLEKKFENFLLILDLKFKYQYEFHGRLFDFYIEKYNVLIEVDGDFYHCNPDSIHKEQIYETQKLTKENDIYKDNLCNNHNIKLLRFWEKDINERPEWVMQILRKELI